ncbi:outer membrane beta-barrel protein, partial [Vibrio metschnikovii]|nr:outer membrane beta-barrel protein [Vibrio metschnikovii]
MAIQKKITIIFLSFLFFNFAHSNDDINSQDESYFYAGQKLGWARYNNCDNKVNCKIDTLGYSVFSGFQFNRWFSLEASLSSYGRPDYKINSDLIESNTSIWGSEILSKFRVLDITNHLHAYAKLGLGYQYLNQPSSYTNKSHHLGLLGAVGLEYDITDQWSLRAEVQHIDFK